MVICDPLPISGRGRVAIFTHQTSRWENRFVLIAHQGEQRKNAQNREPKPVEVSVAHVHTYCVCALQLTNPLRILQCTCILIRISRVASPIIIPRPRAWREWPTKILNLKIPIKTAEGIIPPATSVAKMTTIQVTTETGRLILLES